MKKIAMIVLVLMPFMSCTRYELEGFIDNPDFVNTWISPESKYKDHLGYTEMTITRNGTYRVRERYPTLPNYVNEGRTFRRNGRISIQDTIVRFERRRKPGDPGFGSEPNWLSESRVSIPPTFVDTSYFDAELGRNVNSQGYFVFQGSMAITWFLKN